MGPLKILGLVASALTFLYGLGPSEEPWLIFIGMTAFAACCFVPNEI